MEFQKILETPNEARDQTWEQSFLQNFPHQVVQLVSEVPSHEYDGWPYLHVQTTSGVGEPVSKIINWLSARGIGLIVNAQKKEPDYVFSYGMLWSFKTRGQFIGDNNQNPLQLSDDAKPTIGEPAESVLPSEVRAVIKKFLLDQGIIAPKIVVVAKDDKNFDLAFSIESLGHPPASEHQGILEALAWFLPLDYSLVLAKEEHLPGFELL